MTQHRDPLDAALYVTAPRVDVPSGVALGVELLGAVPKDAPKAVKDAARTLRKDVVHLQDQWRARDASGVVVEVRALDLALDRAWSAFSSRLEAWSGITTSTDDSARAAKLTGELFADGLSFLKLRVQPQWAESEKRLQKLAPQRDVAVALAGEAFVSAVEQTHAELGDALGLRGKPAVEPDAVRLAEPLRAVQQSVAAYALQLVAAEAQADAALSAKLRAALRPIERLRERQAGAEGKSEGSDPVTPVTPVPVVEDEPKG